MGATSDAVRAAARRIFPARVRKRLRWIRATVLAWWHAGDLIALAVLFGTDKWGTHWYAQHYQRHFAHLRHRRLTVLEIGVGGYDDPDDGGESLRVWKWFFPKGQIVGVDIYPKRLPTESRIRIAQGSQDDADFLARLITEVGRPDLIIDDGSHRNEHVLATFKLLFSQLADDGIYVVEDTQSSYWPTWGGEATDRNAPNTSMGFLKSLVDGLNHSEFLAPGAPTYCDRHIVAMHFYHNLVIIQKGANDEASNAVRNGVLNG